MWQQLNDRRNENIEARECESLTHPASEHMRARGRAAAPWMGCDVSAKLIWSKNPESLLRRALPPRLRIDREERIRLVVCGASRCRASSNAL